MINPYQLKTAKILKIQDETENIRRFVFEFERPSFKITEPGFFHAPGQFIILSLPGFGEAAFAPCNAYGSNLELCIRAVGRLTNKLHSLNKGDKVGIRGPFGAGWPADRIKTDKQKNNLLIVVGGLGLIPLRTLILGKNQYLGKDSKVQIFYGAKHPSEMLFRNEYDLWKKNGIDLQLTIDKVCESWSGCVGLVTVLFDQVACVERARAFLCGPPVMYKFVLDKLKEKKFNEEDIYLSFERRMHCGVGVCQHCGVGSFYTCKDGPIFNLARIKNIPGAV